MIKESFNHIEPTPKVVLRPVPRAPDVDEVTAAENKANAPIAEGEVTGLPVPKGFRILIALPEPEKTLGEGLIQKADAAIRNDTVASVIGFVLAMGDDCYKDTTRFPSGPYCKKGDFVLIRSYSGTRFLLRGKEFRMINDDTVEAVVDDPRGYSRFF